MVFMANPAPRRKATAGNAENAGTFTKNRERQLSNLSPRKSLGAADRHLIGARVEVLNKLAGHIRLMYGIRTSLTVSYHSR